METRAAAGAGVGDGARMPQHMLDEFRKRRRGRPKAKTQKRTAPLTAAGRREEEDGMSYLYLTEQGSVLRQERRAADR